MHDGGWQGSSGEAACRGCRPGRLPGHASLDSPVLSRKIRVFRCRMECCEGQRSERWNHMERVIVQGLTRRLPPALACPGRDGRCRCYCSGLAPCQRIAGSSRSGPEFETHHGSFWLGEGPLFSRANPLVAEQPAILAVRLGPALRALRASGRQRERRGPWRRGRRGSVATGAVSQ